MKPCNLLLCLLVSLTSGCLRLGLGGWRHVGVIPPATSHIVLHGNLVGGESWNVIFDVSAEEAADTNVRVRITNTGRDVLRTKYFEDFAIHLDPGESKAVYDGPLNNPLIRGAGGISVHTHTKGRSKFALEVTFQPSLKAARNVAVKAYTYPVTP